MPVNWLCYWNLIFLNPLGHSNLCPCDLPFFSSSFLTNRNHLASSQLSRDGLLNACSKADLFKATLILFQAFQYVFIITSTHVALCLPHFFLHLLAQIKVPLLTGATSSVCNTCTYPVIWIFIGLSLSCATHTSQIVFLTLLLLLFSCHNPWTWDISH